jgi:hypothetical protein
MFCLKNGAPISPLRRFEAGAIYPFNRASSGSRSLAQTFDVAGPISKMQAESSHVETIQFRRSGWGAAAVGGLAAGALIVLTRATWAVCLLAFAHSIVSSCVLQTLSTLPACSSTYLVVDPRLPALGTRLDKNNRHGSLPLALQS